MLSESRAVGVVANSGDQWYACGRSERMIMVMMMEEEP